MKRTVLLALAAVLVPVSGLAASFDCAKAKSAVEKMVCAEAELSKLDEDLAAQYKSTMDAAGSDAERARLRDDQRSWLKERDDCEITPCLRAAYRGRILALKKWAVTWADAQVPKRYPPYPDVWELALPPRGDRPGGHALGLQNIKKTPDGDVVFWYAVDTPGGRQNRLITFFGREALPRSEIDRIWKDGGDELRIRVKTKSGRTLWRASGPRVMNCYSGLYHTVNLSENGISKPVKEKVFLYIRAKPRVHRSPQHCNETHSFTVWAEAGGGRLVPLEDGTFLLVDTTSGIVLRIDENLESRSRLMNDRVFAIDEKEFRDWEAAGNYGDRADKGIDFARMHRDLIKWLNAKRKGAGQ